MKRAKLIMKNRSINSFAKINLFLDVGNKKKLENLHNIRSVIFKVNLRDEIRIKKINSLNDKITFKGFFAKNIKKGNNSVSQSLSLLRNEGYIKPNNYYKIEIVKKIPVFSGFGGGSSNAASIVKYFVKKNHLTRKNINLFSRKLGSDLRLFFYSNQVYQKDLSTIQNIQNKHRFYFLLVYPFLKCSSKEIYSKFKVSKNIAKNSSYNLSSKKNLLKKLKLKNNDLEKVVIKKFPIVKKILYAIKHFNNCQFSRVTGSGSACFGLFLTKKSAELGLKKIKKKFPNYWCVISKTI